MAVISKHLRLLFALPLAALAYDSAAGGAAFAAQSSAAARAHAGKQQQTGRKSVRPQPAKQGASAVYKTEPIIRVDFSAAPLIFGGVEKAANLPDFLGVASAPLALGESEAAKRAAADLMCGQESAMPQAQLNSAIIYAERDIAAALIRFYRRAPALMWSDAQGQLKPQTEQIFAYLAKAGQDGLSPAEYLPPLPAQAENAAADRQAALTEFDLALSARLLRYISDMNSGRIPARLGARADDLPQKTLNLDTALARLGQSAAPAEILAAYRPQSAWYAALQLELAELSENQKADEQGIAPARLGARKEAANERGITHARLGAGKEAADERGFAHARLGARKEAADERGIAPARLRGKDSSETEPKIQAVRHALERLRRLPRAFPADYVFVNIPSQQAQFFENGREKLVMKVVVGSPARPTNIFISKIAQIVFNPSWGVPYSIMKNEMAAKIAKDPSYPARHGYEIFRRGKRVSPEAVNWAEAVRQGSVQIRQKPGNNNALGRLKILFPNAHNIYMHDTPAKAAFARSNRAVSHGCVRLAEPEAMAAAILGQNPSALAPYFKRPQNGIKPKRDIEVYLAYFTAWPQAQTGEVRYYADIYGLDAPMAKAEAAVSASRRQAEEKQAQQRTAAKNPPAALNSSVAIAALAADEIPAVEGTLAAPHRAEPQSAPNPSAPLRKAEPQAEPSTPPAALAKAESPMEEKQAEQNLPSEKQNSAAFSPAAADSAVLAAEGTLAAPHRAEPQSALRPFAASNSAAPYPAAIAVNERTVSIAPPAAKPEAIAIAAGKAESSPPQPQPDKQLPHKEPEREADKILAQSAAESAPAAAHERPLIPPANGG